jgi:hypothetical protein
VVVPQLKGKEVRDFGHFFHGSIPLRPRRLILIFFLEFGSELALIFEKDHESAVFQIALMQLRKLSDSADYFSASETMPGLSDITRHQPPKMALKISKVSDSAYTKAKKLIQTVNYKSLLSPLKGLWRPQMAQQQVGNPPVELVNNLATCT